MAATSVFYRLVFDSRFGRESSNTIRAVQNSIRTDFSFLCYHADGTEYTFQTGDTVTGKFTDRATGLAYTITGTVTPTATTNSMVWVRSLADVALPAEFDLAFKVTSAGAEDDISFNALYIVEETPDGALTPVSPSLTNLMRDWANTPLFFGTSFTYDTTYKWRVNSAVLNWPDGSAGVYTATVFSTNANALGMVDAFTATHTDSGLTATQAAVTRNSNGVVTVKPPMTIA